MVPMSLFILFRMEVFFFANIVSLNYFFIVALSAAVRDLYNFSVSPIMVAIVVLIFPFSKQLWDHGLPSQHLLHVEEWALQYYSS